MIRCPDCEIPLVLRRGRFGKFLGCRNYPQCRFTRDIQDAGIDPEDYNEGLLDPDGRYNATIEIVRDHTWYTVNQLCGPKGPERDRRLHWLRKNMGCMPIMALISEFDHHDCNRVLEACGELTMKLLFGKEVCHE